MRVSASALAGTLGAWLLVPVGDAAAADLECSWVTESKIVKGQVRTTTVQRCRNVDGGTDSPPSAAPVDGGSDSSPTACQKEAAQLGLDPETYCTDQVWASPQGPGQQLTRSTIAQAFASLELPPSALIVQPPDGLTLVNFDTNFYVEEKVIQRTVQLLGQSVQLRVWAASYTWHFGDGEKRTTVDPGAPHPDLRVTHNYLLKGRYSPRVDTTYQAEFRIGSGAWQPVPGTATVRGASVQLRAIEATPKLVGP